MRIPSFIFFLFLFAGPGRSQTPVEITLVNYESKAKNETNAMKIMLSLTDTQANSILVINRDYFFKIASLSDKTKVIKERGPVLQQIEKERNERLSLILTKEQLSKYVSRQKEQKEFLQKRKQKVNNK